MSNTGGCWRKACSDGPREQRVRQRSAEAPVARLEHARRSGAHSESSCSPSLSPLTRGRRRSERPAAEAELAQNGDMLEAGGPQDTDKRRTNRAPAWGPLATPRQVRHRSGPVAADPSSRCTTWSRRTPSTPAHAHSEISLFSGQAFAPGMPLLPAMHGQKADTRRTESVEAPLITEATTSTSPPET